MYYGLVQKISKLLEWKAKKTKMRVAHMINYILQDLLKMHNIFGTDSLFPNIIKMMKCQKV